MKKGLTLIEVLLAIFVLTIGVAGLIASFRASGNQVRASNDIFLASRFAQDKIEELKNMAYADLTDETVWDTTLIGGYLTTRTWTIITATGNIYKEIEVTATWNEGGRPFRRKFVTRRSAE